MNFKVINTAQLLSTWLNVKIAVDQKTNNPPTVDEGQLWWCNQGQNIGSEVYGKGSNFTRPVVVYKKLSRFTFMVIPCSTKLKTGSWYSQFIHNKITMIAVLSQAKVIDYRRLINKIGELDKTDFAKIKQDFIALYQ
jgi:mRNA-degrading endonuclease toxin of MazEF toxin-antitoxin module